MKQGKLNRIWLAGLAFMLVTVACMGTSVSPEVVNTPQPSNGNNTGLTASRENLIAATVQIYGLFNKNGELVPGYVGSGTIISVDGLILTNAHVADPAAVGDPDFHPDALAVGIVTSEDRPPILSYYAEVLAIDGFLDLAVIRITSTLDGGSVDPGDLQLPFVPLGDSDQVHVGDHVNIYGFPAIGGETITYTDGNISGFTAEEEIGARAWLKTDATISGGNSGGLAADDSGRIIGVPSRASSGSGGEITDCRVVQDTNGDGALNSQDNCIPIGGFINALRPINLAVPLINAAKNGLAYNSPYGSVGVTSSGSGTEQFGEVVWLETDADCNTGDPLEAYPSGVSALVASFDFSGMTDGQAWSSTWYLDGEVVYQSNDAWEDGEQGNYQFCLYNTESAVPDGNFRVEFFASDDQEVLSEGSVVVGKGTTAPPNSPPSANGVTLYGTITDASTGRGISGAYVYILMPGITYDVWETSGYSDALVYLVVQTDRDGNYRMPSTIDRNVPYTIVVSAQGYYDKYGDLLTWYDEDPAEYEMSAEMNQ